MKAAESENELRKRLCRPLEQLTPRAGIAAMCSFYADQRADGAAIGSDRDMLLYQWGIDSFNAPESFQASITRQINVTGESQPYQLALNFYFQPTDPLRKINTSNQWCRSPNDLSAFRQFIDSSPAFKAVADAKADRVELQLDRRG
jgi:hypothetical protein